MNINLIAAIGKNNEIGKNNDLIWKLKGDMKFFKEITIGHPVVMGRKTFESLPKCLPGRKNIVITTNEIRNEQIEIYRSIKEFLKAYKNIEEEIFIIGGASLYNYFINIADKIYLTEIEKSDLDADTFFPTINKKNYDKYIINELEENNIQYKHVLYKIKKY